MYAPPSSYHLLGTDAIGRDLFSRLLYGGRISILVGLGGALGASMIGIVLGSLCGYYGGKIDAVILYISEIVSSFPQIMLILIFVGFSGRGLQNLIIVFSITGWIQVFRIVRGKITSLREETFVEACKTSGIGGTSIMFRHLLPNSLGPVIVSITLQVANYVLSEAGMSYLGLGVDPSLPSWGNIINSARSLVIVQQYPILWISPGITISLFVLAVNFLGDGLRDVFDSQQ